MTERQTIRAIHRPVGRCVKRLMPSASFPPALVSWLGRLVSTAPAPPNAPRQALCLFGSAQRYATIERPNNLSEELAQWQYFDTYDDTLWSRIAATTQIVLVKNAYVEELWRSKERIRAGLRDVHTIFMIGPPIEANMQVFVADTLGMSGADSPFLCIRPGDAAAAARETAGRNAAAPQLEVDLPVSLKRARDEPLSIVEASAFVARETGLLARGVTPGLLLNLVLASSRHVGPRRTITSQLRPPAYCEWLEEIMLPRADGPTPRPRRALCLFGVQTHALFTRWCPAALQHRYARRQVVNTLGGDTQRWDETIDYDTQVVVVTNTTADDLAASTDAVRRILERARVVALFQETKVPRRLVTGKAADAFLVISPVDIGFDGEDFVEVAASAGAGVETLVSIGVARATAERIVRAYTRHR